PRRPPPTPLFPYTTLFRSRHVPDLRQAAARDLAEDARGAGAGPDDAEEHLQQRRLAGSVGSDDSREAARPHRERRVMPDGPAAQDRKSTRLNSSHRTISYA